MRRRPPSTGSFDSSAAFDDGGEVVGDDERDGEDRLKLRLVPAGKGLAGVGGLELRDGDDVVVAALVGERRSVEAVQLVVEDAAEPAVQHPRARLERLVERRGGPARSLTRA